MWDVWIVRGIFQYLHRKRVTCDACEREESKLNSSDFGIHVTRIG